MIYTVTLNPSIDYIVNVPNFHLGAVNRAASELTVPGGKGINVSVMLTRLGVENTALGFLAGFTGEEIRGRVRERGCREDFIMLEEGFSRINVKLKTGEETEINGSGPEIPQDALALLMRKLEALSSGDVLVLSGSVPSTVSQTIYRDMMESLSGRDVMIVVDAARSLLADVLPCRPFLIKPNHHELGELFDVVIDSRSEAAVYARRLQERGARNVLVSMAGMGAVLAAEDGALYECDAPKGQIRNSVGAGDSMVAGFLAGYLDGGDYAKALKMGIAAGSASAFSEDLAQGECVLSFYDKLAKDALNKNANL